MSQPVHTTTDGDHGRIEERRHVVCHQVDWLFSDRRYADEPRFPHLAMIGMIESRVERNGENSHQPFRRRERAMQRFRSMKTLQKFSSVHAQVHNHFNQERHLVTRQVYKQRRSAALAEWSALAA